MRSSRIKCVVSRITTRYCCAVRTRQPLLIILSLSLFTIAGNCADKFRNLVPNPGFEVGANDKPDRWSFYSWKQSNGEWSDTNSFAGTKSAKLTGLNGGWSASVPVESGSIHRLTLRYRQEGGAGKIVTYVRLEGGRGAPLLYRSTKAIPASQKGGFIDGQFVEGADANGWVLLDAGSFFPSAGMKKVNLLIKLVSASAEATALIDDVRITAQKPEKLPETARLLHQVPDAVIWKEDENRKILQKQTPPTQNKADGISLDLARGEYGVFQIAVSPERTWRQVNWASDKFTGPAELSADKLRCRRVEFVPVEEPLKPFGLAGLNPDRLTEQLPCDIKAGMNQSFWFTLQIPEDQRPGRYQTSLILTRDTGDVCQIPLRLRVREFAIPSRPSLDIYARIHATEVKSAETGDDNEVLKRYFGIYFKNRARCSTGVSVGARIRGDQAIVKADRFIEMRRYQREQFGVRPFFVPALWISHQKHQLPPDAKWKGRRIFLDAELTKLNPDFEKPSVHFLSQVIERLKAEALFDEPIVRFIDEPKLDHQPTLNGIRTLARLIKGIDPKLTVSLTSTAPHLGLLDVIDQWVLHTDAWSRAAKQIAAARRAGARISVYNNAIAYLEQEPIRIRLWPWLLKKYDVDGSYSWCGTTRWKDAMKDPWNCGRSYFEVMFYPPRTADEHGPISSVRWELFRQGLQDFEYIRLAESLADHLDAAGKPAAAKVGRNAISNAFRLVQKWPRVQPANDRPYTRDPIRLQEARRQLADAIETMTDLK